MSADDGDHATSGRHAVGTSSRTWTPQVATGSGGRRRRSEEVTARDGSTLVLDRGDLADQGGSPHLAARRFLGVRPVDRARPPIRYAPVPGAPPRRSAALWGPPLPAAGA